MTCPHSGGTGGERDETEGGPDRGAASSGRQDVSTDGGESASPGDRESSGAQSGAGATGSGGGCPVDHGPGDATESGGTGDGPSGGVDRREFMKAALTIGGAGALSTVTGLYGMPETAAAQTTARPSVAQRLDRQHAWNDYTHEVNGTFHPPEHHLLLFVDYEGEGEPTAADRKATTAAFDKLEQVLGWHHEGILFTVGYSASYFERFEADPPAGLQPDNGTPIPRMLTAEEIIEGPVVPNLFERDEEGRPTPVKLDVTLDRENPVADDDYDAVIHLASDYVQYLLAAEQALWGEREEWNGIDFSEDNLAGVFSRPTSYPERRTGFVGNDNLASEVDEDALDGEDARERFVETVEDGAPLSMGYSDLYANSMPREDNVTMLEDQRFLPGNPQPVGAFAGGSIAHVSKIDTDLSGWYDENDDTDRRERMFSPHHEKADVGEVGENLGESNAPTETTDLPMRDFTDVATRDVAERTAEDAAAGRNIGHAQKTARARAQLEAHFQPEGERSLFETGVPLQDDPVAGERDDDLANQDPSNQTVETGFLRRDFNTVDNTGANVSGTHFVALQAFSIYTPYMRHAMNGVDFSTGIIGQPPGEQAPGFSHEGEVDTERNGIVEYLDTERRGNFVLPPITLRALPPAKSLRPDIEVEKVDGEYRVTLPEMGLAHAIDPETVRFGYYRSVNAGGGARPSGEPRKAGSATFTFPADETEIEAHVDELPEGEVKVRLFGKRESDLHPVFGTATLTFGEGGPEP